MDVVPDWVPLLERASFSFLNGGGCVSLMPSADSSLMSGVFSDTIEVVAAKLDESVVDGKRGDVVVGAAQSSFEGKQKINYF